MAEREAHSCCVNQTTLARRTLSEKAFYSQLRRQLHSDSNGSKFRANEATE